MNSAAVILVSAFIGIYSGETGKRDGIKFIRYYYSYEDCLNDKRYGDWRRFCLAVGQIDKKIIENQTELKIQKRSAEFNKMINERNEFNECVKNKKPKTYKDYYKKSEECKNGVIDND